MEFQYRNNSGGQFYGSPIRRTPPPSRAAGAGAAATWTSVQYVWDKTAATPYMKIYINGVETTYAWPQLPAGWGTLITSGGMFTVGTDASLATDRLLAGKIDDLAVFKSALSTTDLADVRNTVATLNTTNYGSLVAYWNFDSITDNTVESNGDTNVVLNLRSIYDGVDPAVIDVEGGAATVTITKNSFDGDGKALRETGSVTAENNWWNTVDPAQIDARIDGNADYDPFLLDGTDATALRASRSTSRLSWVPAETRSPTASRPPRSRSTAPSRSTMRTAPR